MSDSIGNVSELPQSKTTGRGFTLKVVQSSNCIVLFSGWIIWWKWRLCVVQSSQTTEWAQTKTRRGEVNIKSLTPLWTGAALNYYAKYYTNDYTTFKNNNFNKHKSLCSASRETESMTVKNRKKRLAVREKNGNLQKKHESTGVILWPGY